eukprot:scaffold387005_cov33-Prasinocladus_malaysianus.AAC.1
MATRPAYQFITLLCKAKYRKLSVHTPPGRTQSGQVTITALLTLLTLCFTGPTPVWFCERQFRATACQARLDDDRPDDCPITACPSGDPLFAARSALLSSCQYPLYEYSYSYFTTLTPSSHLSPPAAVTNADRHSRTHDGTGTRSYVATYRTRLQVWWPYGIRTRRSADTYLEI